MLFVEGCCDAPVSYTSGAPELFPLNKTNPRNRSVRGRKEHRYGAACGTSLRGGLRHVWRMSSGTARRWCRCLKASRLLPMAHWRLPRVPTVTLHPHGREPAIRRFPRTGLAAFAQGGLPTGWRWISRRYRCRSTAFQSQAMERRCSSQDGASVSGACRKAR
jgi:hypothetical protein